MNTPSLRIWQDQYHKRTKDALNTAENLSPEPLFESAPLPPSERVCLVCGNNPAWSALLSPGSQAPVVPLCKTCSVDWNFYGYGILKKIRPLPLLWNVTKWYLARPLQRGLVWGDLKQLLQWQRKMGNLKKTMKSLGR